MHIDEINRQSAGALPGLLGMVFTESTTGLMKARLAVRPELMATNGFLHAGTVVSLADSCAGWGCMANLPAGAESFTTIELKSNFLGSARSGHVLCAATMAHGGRTTQVWDAKVVAEESGKTIALFRCTQMVLYPR